MTVKEILLEWLTAHGFDGLYSDVLDCGCDLTDIVACGECCLDCKPGLKKITDYCEGDWCIVPMPEASKDRGDD